MSAAFLAAGCATDRVTLLENEEGSATGAVAVIPERGGETVIDRPLTQAALGGGAARPRQLKALDPKYGRLLSALPPKARAFVITFPIGDSRIPAEQRLILETIRNELAIRPGAQIEVAGFTDSIGEESLNDEISRKRAQAVAQELREFGFAVAPDDAVGRGEFDARAKRGDEVPDETYRRVEVIVR